MDPFALITITVLAIFLGFEVVSKVSSTLHTPLMSEANAIHGIILLGAIMVAGQADEPVTLTLSIIAVLLATMNVVGGFVVTDRMLVMFSGGRRGRARRTRQWMPQTAYRSRREHTRHPRTQLRCHSEPADAARLEGGRQVKLLSPEVVTAVYLVAAVLFILALKGLSNPRSARRANLLGAAGAAVAVLAYVFSTTIHNIVWIVLAVAVGSVVAVIASRRVQMTQMPQLVAAFNGVGGGAAALVAVVEVTHSESAWTLAVVAVTTLIGGVSLTGSFVTFGKLQGVITTRAVVFPGLRVLLVLALARRRSPSASRWP